MINAYLKGSRTEREVAAIINKAFDTELRRTPMSGAYADFAGDLITTHNPDSIINKWLWEVKNRKAGMNRMLEWYKKALDETPPSKKPVVICTTNNEGYYAFLSMSDFLQLLKDASVNKEQLDEPQ